MPMVVRATPWASQPQQPVSLDPRWGIIGGVLPQGLGDAIFNGAAKLVPGSGYSGTGVLSTVTDRIGRAISKDNDTGDYVAWSGETLSSFSLIAVFTPINSTDSFPIDADNFSTYRFYQFRINSISQPEFIRFDTSGNPYFATATAAARISPCVMIATSSGADMAMYYSEMPFGNVREQTGTISNTPKSGSDHRFFVNMGGSNQSYGTHNLLGIARRAWSRGEAYALLRNPWSLFSPIQRRLYVPSVAVAIPTLSAAAVTSITSTTATPQVTLTF